MQAAFELLTEIAKEELHELQLSERTFVRKFKEYVDISPRMFDRICKFHSLLGQLQSADYSKLSDVASDHDFSDQSHFIRTFKEFTGMTPTEHRCIKTNFAEKDKIFLKPY
ncbi:MAG TPA: helix-turn-helix domain-containing protein [Pricia sp.]|nr:helix-turn-helix domain-containing protein [Pricia sp.]